MQSGDIDFDAADGCGTITVGRSLQRTEKAALEKTDPNQIYHIFPDQCEGSTSALVLKKPKTKKSSRTLYLTKPLRDELQAWLEKLKQDEADFYTQNIGGTPAPEKQNLPDSSKITPEVILKVVRQMNPEQRRKFTRLLFA